jgi:hypothetical protein
MRQGGDGQKDRQCARAQAHAYERHTAEVGKFVSSRHLCRAGLDVAPAAGASCSAHSRTRVAPAARPSGNSSGNPQLRNWVPAFAGTSGWCGEAT